MDQTKLHLLLSQQEITEGVRKLGDQIRSDYDGLSPLLVGVLNGCFIFLADLVRVVNIQVTLDFIQAQSYQYTTSTGSAKVSTMPQTPVGGRHVLLVEDIVDTGITIGHIMGQLQEEEPASLKLCTLLDKPSRRVVSVTADYVGFTVPDKFIVGYGLDLDQQYRYLPDIYVLEEE